MSLKDRKTSGSPKAGARRSSEVRGAYRSRNQREAESNRLVLIAAGVLAAVIVVILGGALFIDTLVRPAQAVASVGGVNVSTRDFQNRVIYERWRQGNLIAQYYNSPFGQQQLTDTNSPIGQLYRDLGSTFLFGKRILDQMVDETTVAIYAKEKGITVSETEIDKSLNEQFGYEPDPKTATPSPTPTITPTPLVSPTPSPSPTTPPTATPLPAGTPTATATIAPTATVTPFPTGLPTNTPGATEQKENFNKQTSDVFKSAAKLTGFSEAEIRDQFRQELYRQELLKKVKESVGGKLEPIQEQNKARHILVTTEDQAKDVIAALQAGESFAALAKAVSTDTSSGANGGELGWATRGQYVKEFEEYVWTTGKIGEVSAPIKTQFGFHIIQLTAKENRPLSPEQQQTVQDRKYSDWLTKTKEEKKVTTYDYWSDRAPDYPNLSAFGLPAPTGAGF
jgi:hypothetical protein